MSERTPLIAANWKMHPAPIDLSVYKSQQEVDVVVFPSFLDLRTCIETGLVTGAQCARPEEQGAHTGDVSMHMLKQIGCTHVLCGHSERRNDHGESNAFVAAQVASAQRLGIHPILCVGETQEQRAAGKEQEVVHRQLTAVASLTTLTTLTIAYEPVWAIGTGNTATPEDAQTMHSFIRSFLPDPSHTRILYGGSMKPENAAELLAQADIDGGLVGGASLDPQQCREIIRIAALR